MSEFPRIWQTIELEEEVGELRKILQQKPHFSASHWDPSKLTHLNVYISMNSSLSSSNTFRNVSIYQDPNDTLKSVALLQNFCQCSLRCRKLIAGYSLHNFPVRRKEKFLLEGVSRTANNAVELSLNLKHISGNIPLVRKCSQPQTHQCNETISS